MIKFKNKTLMITGGTGSFGNAVLSRFLQTDVKEIRILSRDEKKQDDMRHLHANSKLKFYIGDVRDPQSLKSAMVGVDYVFHAAALKQVPSCEFHPLEAVKTNVIGTENIIDAAIHHGISKVICLSTDKAVYPINAMGISKAMMEKVVLAKSRYAVHKGTTICLTRYGNVIASRGSVIPLFINQLLNNKPVTITDPNMTRFMMTLDEAVKLVLFAFEHGQSGDLFVQKAPAASIEVLAQTMKLLFNKPQHPINIIGTRHGEKLYESLLTREEMAQANDLGDYFRVPIDQRDLHYTAYIDKGEQRVKEFNDYTSHNTAQLSINELEVLLSTVDYVKEALSRTEEVENA